LLFALNIIIASPPQYFRSTDGHGNIVKEPVGVPIYSLLGALGNTRAGHDLFRKPAFNAAVKKLLDSWGKYLTTPASTKTLTDNEDGWFSSDSLAVLEGNGRGNFNLTYKCPNPHDVNRGFTSWDAFFTREVLPSARPVASPEDENVLRSPCESTVYRICSNVKLHDQFWLKGQPYSLYDMLDRDQKTASMLAGGTVYQAFLSTADYHRWRSPISGVIEKTVIVPGTYFAVLPDVDDHESSPGPIRSQPWLTMHATRALIYIKSDNPSVGLMVFMAIGMTEISTCEITARQGQRVSAGDELGMFHYGGSSCAMIFGPYVRLRFDEDVTVGKHTLVNSRIACFVDKQ
jgi:phosphatidylserine decarboxylase